MHPWCFLFGLPEDDGQFICSVHGSTQPPVAAPVIRIQLCQPAGFIRRHAVKQASDEDIEADAGTRTGYGSGQQE